MLRVWVSSDKTSSEKNNKISKFGGVDRSYDSVAISGDIVTFEFRNNFRDLS